MQQTGSCRLKWMEKVGRGLVEGDAALGEIPFAKSPRVRFVLNADCSHCRGWLEFVSFNYAL